MVKLALICVTKKKIVKTLQIAYISSGLYSRYTALSILQFMELADSFVGSKFA